MRVSPSAEQAVAIPEELRCFPKRLVAENLSVIAFHEKAGRSQGNSGFIANSWFFSLTRLFSRRVAAVAMLPSALSKGVLGSVGAAT